jgi:hypothetical protein
MVAKAREARFPLGRLVATPGALAAFQRTGQPLQAFVLRHVHGDWGELDAHDRAQNDWSVDNEARILSAYKLADGTRVWVITEADRSSTCVLLPEEY